MSEHNFNVGDKVIAQVEMISDLRDEGMSCYHCASKGNTLVIEYMRPGSRFIGVYRENDAQKEVFSVTADEIKKPTEFFVDGIFAESDA